MDLQDDANLPPYNLAKTVHHAWLMQFGKNFVDIYDTTTDDFIII
jgi:hypothetical protein